MIETPSSPRAASALLSEALGHLDALHPAAVREPVRFLFRAAIERCVCLDSLLGTNLVPVLELARALVEADKEDA